MDKTNLIIIIGKSCSGKTHTAKYINKALPGSIWVPQYTTRKMRVEDVGGKTYNFISKKEFLEMASDRRFLEFNEFKNDWYGTDVLSIKKDKTNIIINNPRGTFEILEKIRRKGYIYNDIESYILYLDVPFNTRFKRNLARAGKINYEFFRRTLADKHDFEYIDDKIQNYCIGKHHVHEIKVPKNPTDDQIFKAVIDNVH